MELHDKIAIVTGASRGIGFATARALGREGCRLGICARTTDDLEEAADALRTESIEVVSVTADVSEETSVRRFAARVRQAFGPPDILVNNAGIGVFGTLDELSPDDLDRCLETNVRGPFVCAKVFVPDMLEQEDGVVVNVASLAGKNFFAEGSVYAASKHAVMGMSKSLMLELRDRGVRVLTVCPGSVNTAFFDEESEHGGDDRDWMLRPDAVAEAIVEAIRLSDRGTVSEIEIRPVNP